MPDPVKSFASPSADPIVFEINGEPYTVRAVVPGGVMLRFMRLAQVAVGGMGDSEDPKVRAARMAEMTDAMDAMIEFGGEILEPESAERLVERINGRGGPPIDFNLLMEDLLPWLVEQVTERPTELPSGSPAGPNETGSTSTESSGSAESTPVT